MSKIERRDFLKKASIAAVGGSTLIFGCGENKPGESPAVHTRKKYEWRMVTSWQPHFPILGEGADEMAKNIELMSEGQLKIQVYGGGELVPSLESFDAVSQGIAEMGHAAAYYWAGKSPAAQFFTTIPFGMNAQQTNAWLYYGGGIELWRDLYNQFNLLPFPAGNTGGQMGGWFNKKINSVEDLKGLKMRIPGLGGKVISKSGGSAILSAMGEIYTNLERGLIDATEWIGPYHDYLMGFHKIAKYYYYPGWHEPSATLELMVNKNAYESLPTNLKEIINYAAHTANDKMLSEFEDKNTEYLLKLYEENEVEILPFPNDVLEELRINSFEVINEIVAVDQQSKKIYDSYIRFMENVLKWNKLMGKK
jgi:TRAP-type mannitol/chloroaromatic compound transport system substrate-binding protein